MTEYENARERLSEDVLRMRLAERRAREAALYDALADKPASTKQPQSSWPDEAADRAAADFVATSPVKAVYSDADRIGPGAVRAAVAASPVITVAEHERILRQQQRGFVLRLAEVTQGRSIAEAERDAAVAALAEHKARLRAWIKNRQHKSYAAAGEKCLLNDLTAMLDEDAT